MITESFFLKLFWFKIGLDDFGEDDPDYDSDNEVNECPPIRATIFGYRQRKKKKPNNFLKSQFDFLIFQNPDPYKLNFYDFFIENDKNTSTNEPSERYTVSNNFIFKIIYLGVQTWFWTI